MNRSNSQNNEQSHEQRVALSGAFLLITRKQGEFTFLYTGYKEESATKRHSDQEQPPQAL